MPDIEPNMQVDWLLIISRMKVIDFLIKIAGYQADDKNQSILNQVERTFHINNVSNMIYQMLPEDALNEQLGYYQNLLRASGIPNILM